MDPFENNKLELEGLPQLGDQDFEMLPKRYFRLRMWTWGATLFDLYFAYLQRDSLARHGTGSRDFRSPNGAMDRTSRVEHFPLLVGCFRILWFSNARVCHA